MGDYVPMPHDMPDEFSATPFVSGALTGRRSFRVIRDKDTGRPHLWGPVFDADWITDGVNHAECKPFFTSSKTPHKVAAPGCKCGFWAYFAESPETRTYRHSIHNGFGVEGVIFGFGLCGAGERGFRCAKARIKALVVPDECADLDLLQETMDLFRDNGDFRWYGTIDAAIHDFPLSRATRYGFTPPVEPEVA